MPTANAVVYNLFWFSEPPGRIHNPAPVTRKKKSTLSRRKGIAAIILYPAMLTPEILVGDDDLEILLLSQCDDLAKVKQQVLVQLKVTEGFDAEKPVCSRPLLVDSSGNAIDPAPDIQAM